MLAVYSGASGGAANSTTIELFMPESSRIAGNATHATWRQAFVLPPGSAAGEFRFTSLTWIEQQIGRSNDLDAQGFVALALAPSSFILQGRVAEAEIVAFSVTPEQIDVTRLPSTVEMSISIRHNRMLAFDICWSIYDATTLPVIPPKPTPVPAPAHGRGKNATISASTAPAIAPTSLRCLQMFYTDRSDNRTDDSVNATATYTRRFPFPAYLASSTYVLLSLTLYYPAAPATFLSFEDPNSATDSNSRRSSSNVATSTDNGAVPSLPPQSAPLSSVNLTATFSVYNTACQVLPPLPPGVLPFLHSTAMKWVVLIAGGVAMLLVAATCVHARRRKAATLRALREYRAELERADEWSVDYDALHASASSLQMHPDGAGDDADLRLRLQLRMEQSHSAQRTFSQSLHQWL